MENNTITHQVKVLSLGKLCEVSIIFAYEGSDKKSTIAYIGLLYIPFFLAYNAGRNSSPKNDTAKTIAEKRGKRVMRLEEDLEQLFSLKQKIALATIGVITIPLSPGIYWYLKSHGDPYEVGTKAYEKRMAMKEKGKKKYISRLINYAFISNLNERNRIMANRSVDILQQEPGNLLLICGEAHLDGIIENLHHRLKLKEVRSFP